MVRLASSFWFPQTTAPSARMVGVVMNPLTGTPPIWAEAEPGTSATFTGRKSRTSVSNASESPLLVMVTV